MNFDEKWRCEGNRIRVYTFSASASNNIKNWAEAP
jgi:hypothetical protein